MGLSGFTQFIYTDYLNVTLILDLVYQDTFFSCTFNV